MIGKLTSVGKDGPERDTKILITPTEVYSEISSPLATYKPEIIDHYEIFGFQQEAEGLVKLVFVLSDQRRVHFYSTQSRFDMALLLDELDATIGERPRKIVQS